MGHSTVIIDYLGVGVLASRPAVPNIETGCGALWFSTDIIRPSLWTGSSWLDIVGAAPAAGLVSSDGTIFEATTLGAGLGWATGTLTNTGVITFGGTGGAIVLGANLSMTGNTLEVGAGAGGVVSVGGASGTIGTTGNISVVSNTLTLAGMAAEAIPAAALTYSTGTHIAAATVSADFSFTGGTLSLVGIEHTANKGAASGYAPLDGAGLVPLANLPPVLSEAIYFAGTWNAATGTTSLSTVLASGTGSAGAMFKVTTAGTTTLDGIAAWAVGDQAVFSGLSNTWQKLDGVATEVQSVGGATGSIGVTGNLTVAGGVLTLIGMAAESVPGVGLVLSNGSHVAAATLDPSLTLIGSTLAFRTVGAHQLLGNPGTAAATPSDISLVGNISLTAGGSIVLSGMAAETITAAGLVQSTGTHVTPVTLDPSLTLSGNTLAVAASSNFHGQTITLATVAWGAGAVAANGTIVIAQAFYPACVVLDMDYTNGPGAGSVTADLKIGGTDVTGLSAVVVSSTSSAAASGANTIAAGGSLSLVLSGLSGTVDGAISIRGTIQ